MSPIMWTGIAYAAVLASAALWLWPRPRVLRAIDAEQQRRADWMDEPGDPTHERIDQALDMVGLRCGCGCGLPLEQAKREARANPGWLNPDQAEADVIRGAMEQAEQWQDQALAIASHTEQAMRRLEYCPMCARTHDHATAEEAADCPTCSPSGLPRRIEGGDET